MKLFGINSEIKIENEIYICYSITKNGVFLREIDTGKKMQVTFTFIEQRV